MYLSHNIVFEIVYDRGCICTRYNGILIPRHGAKAELPYLENIKLER